MSDTYIPTNVPGDTQIPDTYIPQDSSSSESSSSSDETRIPDSHVPGSSSESTSSNSSVDKICYMVQIECVPEDANCKTICSDRRAWSMKVCIPSDTARDKIKEELIKESRGPVGAHCSPNQKGYEKYSCCKPDWENIDYKRYS